MLGHELLATLASLNTTPTVGAVMRHAARHPIVNPAEPTLAEITTEGAQAATAFGTGLRGFDRLRLFHSPVKRCGQTAACIADGASKAGLAVELAGAREELGPDYILDQPEIGRLTVQHGEGFVRLWVENKIPAGLIRSAQEVATRHTNFIAARLRDPITSGRRLDLHVSHDWNIILLRELLLNIRFEDAGWLTFLDGIAFTPEASATRAHYRQHSATLPPI